MDEKTQKILEFCEKQAISDFLASIPSHLHVDLLLALEWEPLKVPPRFGPWRRVYSVLMVFIHGLCSNKEPKPYGVHDIIQEYSDQLEKRFGHWR